MMLFTMMIFRRPRMTVRHVFTDRAEHAKINLCLDACGLRCLVGIYRSDMIGQTSDRTSGGRGGKR